LVKEMHFRRQQPFRMASGRARSLTLQTAQKARRAKRELLVIVPAFVGTIVVYAHREEFFGLDTPVRIVAAALMLLLGWQLARDLGRFAEPALHRRMDAATAGTVGFLTRLVFIVVATLTALRVAGLTSQTLAVGGAITAVVVGLAAQQTLGNLIAGMVLLAAHPFRVGERIRLQAGALAGQVEGVVSTLGLLYTTVALGGGDSIMVPNNQVLSAAIVPLKEPASVDLRARLRPDVVPSQIQALLDQGIETPVRGDPHVAIEEIDHDEVVVRVAATPLSASDGSRLADEVLSALASVTRGVEDGTYGLQDGDDRKDHDGSEIDEQSGRSTRTATAERDGRRHDSVTQHYES
jgi:small-conductance mechanosensitive channel